MNEQDAPHYYGYHGHFASVTICENCGCTGLYEDNHPADPCWRCGQRTVKKITVGAKWIKPEIKGFWLWKKVIKRGLWQFAPTKK